MPASAKISVLLFDWDGTLADSAQLGLAAYQKTFADLGINFGLETYEAAYSPNWYLTYEALGVPKEKWALADELWNRHYQNETAKLFEGAAETVSGLHRVGRELNESALADLFEVVICHEHVAKRKPHPEGLQIALARLAANQDEAAYVGDTPEDVLMGKRANILTVGVRSNCPSSARLFDSAPDLLVESIKDLSDHFRGVTKLE
jgi:pyrophosphatase PpaX